MLGLFSALTLVVGNVIGSGIFFMPRSIAGALGNSAGLILVLWIVCGAVNLCGALALGELASMMPHTGGMYVYLREAYGRTTAFLWSWAEFWVIRSGAIAALASAMAIAADNLAQLYGFRITAHQQQWLAIAVIVGLSGINIAGTHWGGRVQNLTTIIKGSFLGFLAVMPFFAAGSNRVELTFYSPDEVSFYAALGTSLAAIMWAYDGWNHVTAVAGEIKEPQRNVPLALGGGVVILMVLYTGANLGYHWTLSSADLAASTIPAVAVTRTLWGEFGARLMTALIMISVFGALNSNILLGPRVMFAAAQDHRFLGPIRRVDPRFRTPAIAIGSIATWSVILILLADFTRPQDSRLFEVLVRYTIFGGSLFYLASVMAVFVLRQKLPDAPRPYRAWGYPILPAIFVIAYAFLLVSMLTTQPLEARTSLLFIVAGLLIYWVIPRRFRDPPP